MSNECFGGLVLSASGEKAYKALKGIHWYDDYQRDDEILLKIYERLGREGFEKHCCKPTIVTIPEAVEVWLEIDDGWETLYWKTSEGNSEYSSLLISDFGESIHTIAITIGNRQMYLIRILDDSGYWFIIRIRFLIILFLK